MADEIRVTDLFGDVVPPAREGRGRPPHLWSRENSDKVLLAFALERSPKDAATAIGISVPTLYKVYFNECAKRRSARLRMEMTQLARLNAEAEKGNVTAEKELAKMLERLRLRDQVQADSPAPRVKPPKLGKKEQARRDAAEVTGLYEPPAPPSSRLQ